MIVRSNWTSPVIIDLALTRPVEQDLRRAAENASPSDTEEWAVVIAEERAAPIPVGAQEQLVVAECLERIAMLGRHRDQRPLRERARIEARLLAQVDALLAAGATVAEVQRFWEDESAEDPWATWAAVFVLGSTEGASGQSAVLDLLTACAEDEARHGVLAAEALLISPHPERASLGRDLLRSTSPAARGAGIELLSRLGELEASQALLAIEEDQVLVKAAGLRALARRANLGDAVERVRWCLRMPDPRIAWEAARALTLHGYPDAREDLRNGRALGAELGVDAIEILVMAGAPSDLGVLERLVKRLPMSAEVLSAVARFGHPAVWPYLVHGLGRDECAEDAARALETLFGALVDAEEDDAASAWRAALPETPIPPDAHLRRGEAWSAKVVLAECASGALRRREVELRYDELRARGGRVPAGDLAAWGSAPA